MRLFLLALALMACSFVSAQKNEGVVQYDEKMNMHRNLPPDAADMRAMIPEFRTNKNELLFNASESLYKNVEVEDEDDDAQNGGVMIKITAPEATLYNNFATHRKAHLREFMDQRYLILDSLTAPAWKITGESKMVLGYNCLQAVYSDTLRKREVSAWFTDAIPVSAGPVGYFGLPGLVLEVDVNQGEMMWIATKIDFRQLKKNEMTAPSKGEKTTQAEFDKKVAEQMKAMGGGGIRIIRN